MRKLLTLAAVLCATACNKQPPVPTVPERALAPDRELTGTSPTGESQLYTPVEPEPEPDEEEAPLLVEVPPTNGDTAFLDPGAAEPVGVTKAVAVIAPTRGNKVSGTVTFAAAETGVEMTAEITGLPPGPHAFHVHVYGDCSAPDAASAGGHFHFTGSSAAPTEHIITGDLGELSGDQGGTARVTATIESAKLQGAFSILGRAVVIHENGNDETHPPDGNAGKRLGCGVIGLRE